MHTIEDLTDKRLDTVFGQLLDSAILEGKEVTLVSTGGCMQPLIGEGDQISFKRVDINRVKPWDIIVFKHKNHYISHRVIKIISKTGQIYIVTKSDTFIKNDEAFKDNDFIGLVTKIKKKNRIIYLDTFRGKSRSYLNIIIGPFYLRIKKNRLVKHLSLHPHIRINRPKQKKAYFEHENEFLRLALQINPAKGSMDRFRQLLSDNLNWDYIAERIRWNYIAPFISNNLINTELKDYLPIRIQENVRRICTWQLYRNTRLYTQLNSVLAAFKQNNINVIMLKGVHLAQEVYGDTFLRGMGDIDILAQVINWDKIKGILQELGFRTADREYDSWGLDYLDNHITFLKEDIKLELKFNIWHMDFPAFKKDLWQRARIITLAGQQTLVPSIEDTLLIACINLTRHNYAGLIWMYDIRRIVEEFQNLLDWNEVIKRAKEKNIDTMVYYSLYYSSRNLNYKIPLGVLEELRPCFIKRKLHEFFWNEKIILWQEEGYPPRAKIPFEVAVILFAGKIRLRIKELFRMFIYVSKIIIPSRIYLVKRYRIKKDSVMALWYYLLRLLKTSLILLKSMIAIILSRRIH